jgi:hypothetical protein
MAEWYYLDGITSRGPITDVALERMLQHSDFSVWRTGFLGWESGRALFGAAAQVTPVQLDDYGQPDRAINRERRMDREVNELIGLLRGVLLDGSVSENEVHALDRWFVVNREICGIWPADVLSARIRRVLADGVVDADERADLLALFQKATGETPETPQAMNRATRLPLDDPAPLIVFPGSQFVFTGKTLYGTRRQCEAAVCDRGGTFADTITRRLRYLVIGELGSRDWIQSTHGRKIEDAVALRTGGHPVSIVDEQTWARALQP